MKTKLEIINETVEYYSHPNRRAQGKYNGCEYITKDGRMCAVGRCLKDPDKLRNLSPDADELDLENLLKEEYLGHENEFWYDLQTLHDSSIHWKDNKLSAQGTKFVEFLKNKWTKQTECS